MLPKMTKTKQLQKIMNIEIPKFHETFNPILEILSNGETIHTRELQKKVIERYFSNLTEEQ